MKIQTGFGSSSSLAPVIPSIISQVDPGCANVPSPLPLPGTTQFWVNQTTQNTFYFVGVDGTGCAVWAETDPLPACSSRLNDCFDANTFIDVDALGGDSNNVSIVTGGAQSAWVFADGKWHFGATPIADIYQVQIEAPQGGLLVSQSLSADAGATTPCAEPTASFLREGNTHDALVRIGNISRAFDIYAGGSDYTIGQCSISAPYMRIYGDSSLLGLPAGDIGFPWYENTRDDSVLFPPKNFLYTDSLGDVKAAPMSAISTECIRSPNEKTTVCATDTSVEIVVCGDPFGRALCNGDLQLDLYPNTRNDGCTDTVLYTDATGTVQHGSIRLGFSVLGTITSAPSLIPLNSCKRIFRWYVDTNGGTVDISSINTAVPANIRTGDVLSFRVMGPGTMIYTDELGDVHPFFNKEVLTLDYDSSATPIPFIMAQ